MDEAGSGEGDELGLGVAPRRERGGPFARPVERIDLVTAGDDSAIDEAGDDGGELAGGGSDHRLVEEREAFGNAALTKKDAAMKAPGERDKIGLTEAVAGGRGRLSHGDGRAEVARHQAATGGGEEEISLLGAILCHPLEDALGPRQPSAGLCGFAEPMEAHA